MNTGLLSLALEKLHYTRAISFFLLFNLCHSASFPLYPLFIKIYIYINLLYYSIARSFAKVSSETINETVLFIYFFIIRRTECTYWIFATKMDRSHANCNFVLSSRVNWFTLVDTRSLSSFTVKTLSYTVGSLYSAIRHDFPRVTRTTLFSGNSSSRLLRFASLSFSFSFLFFRVFFHRDAARVLLISLRAVVASTIRGDVFRLRQKAIGFWRIGKTPRCEFSSIGSPDRRSD